MGYSPWGHKGSDTTEHACLHHVLYKYPGGKISSPGESEMHHRRWAVKPVFGGRIDFGQEKGNWCSNGKEENKPKCLEMENHRVLLGSFSVISTERMSKSRREAGPEIKVRKRWQKP